MTLTPTWLNVLLQDPSITDLCLNGPHYVFMDQGSGMTPYSIPGSPWDPETYRQWILSQISLSGKTWDARSPFLDFRTPTNHRMHVLFPPISPHGILVSLRRLPDTPATTAPRWENSLQGFEILKHAVAAGQSLLLCGSTGSGKTTLANDLLHFVPAHDRIIALEDIQELNPTHSHFISLQSRSQNADGFGEVTLRELLRQALRMRPNRIILGECRGAEVLDLLQILNTGHQGAMATLHANSARDALKRLELLCLLASGGKIHHSVIRDLIATGIQWVTYVKREESGRKIQEIWKVEGKEGDTILMRPMLKS